MYLSFLVRRPVLKGFAEKMDGYNFVNATERERRLVLVRDQCRSYFM